MPRPTEETLYGTNRGTPTDAPDAPSNFTTSVVAPLDVKAAPSESAALAAALGQALNVATPYVQNQIQQGQDQQAADGANDALLGQVDPQKMATLQSYARAVTKTNAQQGALAAAQEAQQFYAQHKDMSMEDSSNEDGSTVPGLKTSIDNIFRSHFPQGQEQDPVQAAAMAPILQHTFAEIAGQKITNDIQANQQNAEDTQQALLMHSIQTGNPALFNVQDSLGQLAAAFGGDKRAAASALVHSVGEAAVSTGKPELIASLLPQGVDFGGGAGLTPENQAYLDTATQRATAAQQRNQSGTLEQSEMNITKYAMAGHDPTAMLEDYSKLPGAQYTFYRSTMEMYQNQGKGDDKAPPAASFDLQSAVYTGDIASASQAQQWVNAHGYKGDAAVQLMTKAVAALGETQRTTADDPNYKATNQYLDQQYRNLNPMTPWDSVAAKQQHANVMQTYVQTYNQLVGQGKAPADAASQASAQAQQQWGTPLSEAKQTPKVLQSPQDQAAFIRNRGNLTPSALNAAGLNGSTIKQLRDRNLISSDEANAAAAALLNH